MLESQPAQVHSPRSRRGSCKRAQPRKESNQKGKKKRDYIVVPSFSIFDPPSSPPVQNSSLLPRWRALRQATPAPFHQMTCRSFWEIGSNYNK